MAEGYMSWDCPDLNTTLYSFDIIGNPDTPGDCFCPLVRPFGFNIMAQFEADIHAAHAAGVDWSSSDLTLARVYSGAALTNYYIKLRVSYVHSDQTLGSVINVEIFDEGVPTPGVTRYTFDYSNYTTWPEYRKRLYIGRYLLRSSMLYANLPGYSGKIRYIIFFSAAPHLYTGQWEEPYSTYPHGRMIYTDIGINDIDGCLLSIPCASDDTESRMEQSEGLPGINYLQQHRFQTDDTDFVLTDASGSYNPDPDTPRKPDPNENDPTGPSGPGGGDGDHRQPYPPIPIPDVPTIGPNSAGFVYMLRLSVAQMQQFSADLVKPSWWSAIKNFFADPLDFICGIMIVPYQPESRLNVYPKFGDNIYDHAYPLVYQQYTVIDCGNLAVPKYFGSALDFNPYQKLLVWLPYIGYRELDPDECMDKTLHIVYHCCCLTGDCVCYISTVAGSGLDVPYDRVVAQFSGNCGVRVPFGAQSFDAAIAASVQLLGGAVGTYLGGRAAVNMGAKMAAGQITESQISSSIEGSTVSAVNGAKTATERSGTAGASAGYLSIQYPYLLRTVPRQSLPTNYQKLEGYPSNVAGPLSKFYGYVAVETIDLNGIQATKAELDEIRALLRGGVYI